MNSVKNIDFAECQTALTDFSFLHFWVLSQNFASRARFVTLYYE